MVTKLKKSSIIPEVIIFVLILFFLIIPPFFTPQIDSAEQLFDWSFPWKQAGLCAFAVVLYFLSRNLNPGAANKKIFYPSIFALCILFFTALVIKLITTKSGQGFTRTMQDSLPDSFVTWIFCILTFIFSAIYEEMIYRFYFSDALKRLVKINSNKLIDYACEAAGVLVFAFAHYYLGIAAVINAVIAHVVLRFLYKKTGLIWNCVIIHFLYNMISLILL